MKRTMSDFFDDIEDDEEFAKKEKPPQRDLSEGENFGDNFTMVSDALTDEFGIIVSATFGYIFRKALKEGYSYCSKNSISVGLKCSPKKVRDAIKILEDNNLIINATPPEYTSKTQVQYYVPLMDEYHHLKNNWNSRIKTKKVNSDRIVEVAREKRENLRK